MKFFLKILFLVSIISVSSVKADELDEVLCNKSSSCKKVCKLQKNTTYNDLKPEDQQAMVNCVNDIVAEINAKTPGKN